MPTSLMLTYAYGLGVGVPVIIVAVSVASARAQIIDQITRFAPKLQKISGIALLAVGVYILSYYLTYGV